MEGGQLGLHQLAGKRGKVRGHAHHGSMRAVRGRERVVDVEIAQRGQPARESGIVRLVLLVIADVFEQEDLARLQPVHGLDRRLADAVFGELDFPAHPLPEMTRHGLER